MLVTNIMPTRFKANVESYVFKAYLKPLPSPYKMLGPKNCRLTLTLGGSILVSFCNFPKFFFEISAAVAGRASSYFRLFFILFSEIIQLKNRQIRPIWPARLEGYS